MDVVAWQTGFHAIGSEQGALRSVECKLDGALHGVKERGMERDFDIREVSGLDGEVDLVPLRRPCHLVHYDSRLSVWPNSLDYR